MESVPRFLVYAAFAFDGVGKRRSAANRGLTRDGVARLTRKYWATLKTLSELHLGVTTLEPSIWLLKIIVASYTRLGCILQEMLF